MKKMRLLHGVIPVLTTPIQENGDILLECVLKMVGSEAESAHRMRKLRAKKKIDLIEQIPSQCDVEKSKRRDREEKRKSAFFYRYKMFANKQIDYATYHEDKK